MSYRTLNLLAWTDSSRPGLFSFRFGPMPSDRATRVSRPMCSCSARSTCLWCTTTGCFVGGYPISLSVGTTWNVCESSYISRRHYSNVLSLLRLRAARDLLETLAPGRGGQVFKERDDSVRRRFGRSRCVHSPSSRLSRMSGNWQALQCMTAGISADCTVQFECRPVEATLGFSDSLRGSWRCRRTTLGQTWKTSLITSPRCRR